MHSTGNTDLSSVADTANRAAIFEPMTNEDERPMIIVAGVHAALYVDPASGLGHIRGIRRSLIPGGSA